jgi:hypothetical protein
MKYLSGGEVLLQNLFPGLRLRAFSFVGCAVVKDE